MKLTKETVGTRKEDHRAIIETLSALMRASGGIWQSY